MNRGTLNNQLARTLAPRTEALLLTSATPHNGDPDSFAELIRLLDPTAIADPTNIRQLVDAGATAVVAGTAVFKGGPDHYAANIAALRPDA